MKILSFELSGTFAHFKKEITVNVTTERYLTFGQLTPTALKGLLGAILGFNGLAKAYRERTTIEFLERLEGMEYAIVPINKNMSFEKEIVKGSNTTGFANKGSTNLMEHEYLVSPKWKIFIRDSFDSFDTLCNQMLSNKTTYPLTLGKNGLQAVYSNVEVLELERFPEDKKGLVLDNIVPLSKVTFEKNEEDDLDVFSEELPEEKLVVVENLPVGYCENFKYTFELFKQTTGKVLDTELDVYSDGEYLFALHK